MKLIRIRASAAGQYRVVIRVRHNDASTGETMLSSTEIKIEP